MAEVAGTAIGVISLGITVAQELYQYYAACRDQQSDVVLTTKRLGHLLSWLQKVETALEHRRSRNDNEDPKLLSEVDSQIEDCRELIAELVEELHKVKPLRQDGTVVNSIRATKRRLAYPFRKSTLQRLTENVDDFVSHLQQTLQLLEHKDISQIGDRVGDVSVLLHQVRADQVSDNIREWLKAPDATLNFNEIIKNRHEKTGSWFVHGPNFTTWLHKPASFLWLIGFAGSGKSVLCSTAIDHASQHRRPYSRVGIAFFYFTFNDKTKQDASAMLRALILQLSGQLDRKYRHLSTLYGDHCTGTPPVSDLVGCLRQLIWEFDHVYIFLDALDESPLATHREELLECLEEIRGWSELNLHILVSSREEVDIRDSLEALPEDTIKIQNAAHDRDIECFISGSLQKRLKKWKKYHDRIETALATRCNGVFRWVECQLQALQGCPRSEHLLERHLQKLPKTLEETYERILSQIPPSWNDYAQRVLMLLCCAMRPLTVEELIDGIAVELGETPKYNSTWKLEDFDSIQEICPGLTELDVDPGTDETTIRIAHFSVREYLESEEIQSSKFASIFSVRRKHANAQMTCICLAILLEPLSEEPTDASDVESRWGNRNTMVPYASAYWLDHYWTANEDCVAHAQMLRLFKDTEELFDRWVLVMTWDLYRRLWFERTPLHPRGETIFSQLYTASRFGLNWIVRDLLVDKDFEYDRNQHAGIALQTASAYGHGDIVQLLIGSGAHPSRGDSEEALRLASQWGYCNIVQLLLDFGVDVDGGSGQALNEASGHGHDKVAELLIKHGATINIPNAKGLVPLGVASTRGHLGVVQLLVNNGADVHADNEVALRLATKSGHKEIVRFLIDKGADIHINGDAPLTSAAANGDKELAQFLLNNGADVYANAQGALHDAAQGGCDEVVQLLIDHGADVNARNPGVAALQLASAMGKHKTVRILIANGADVNAQGGPFGSAIQAASSQGFEECVRILIEHKADVNAHGGRYGSALHAASARGNEKIVQILLDHKADVKMQPESFGTPLQAALSGRHKKVVELLENHAPNQHIVGLGRPPSYDSVFPDQSLAED